LTAPWEIYMVASATYRPYPAFIHSNVDFCVALMRIKMVQLNKLVLMCKKDFTRHHRLPQSKGGTDLPTNISMVPRKKHEAWHTLFENKSVEEIVELLNDIWIDPYYKITYERREVKDPKQLQMKFHKEQKHVMKNKEEMTFYNH